MMLKRRARKLSPFADELNGSVLAELVKWESKPELNRILANLRSHANRKAFFDTFAEAMIARQLIARGCELRFEVPTPSGKQCDFEVAFKGQRFYLHVKRLDTDRPSLKSRKMLAAFSRLRILERIRRPYVAQVRWNEDLNDEQMQWLVTQAAEFLKQGHVGDEMKAYDENGNRREIGGVRIIEPWKGSHVSVTIGLPSGFVDHAPRFRRLMQRAYQQFMPKAVNLIVICSAQEDDARDFETALLGSHIERWDAYPPRGKQVAHGRAADGFWSGERVSDSLFAAWCLCPQDATQIDCRLWAREPSGAKHPMLASLKRLFDCKSR